MIIRNSKSKKEVTDYIDMRLEEEYKKIVQISVVKSEKKDVFTINFAKMYYELEEEIKRLFGKYYSYKYFNDYWNDKLSSKNDVVRLSWPIDVEQTTVVPVSSEKVMERHSYWKYFMKATYTVEHNRAVIFIVKWTFNYFERNVWLKMLQKLRSAMSTLFYLLHFLNI